MVVPISLKVKPRGLAVACKALCDLVVASLMMSPTTLVQVHFVPAMLASMNPPQGLYTSYFGGDTVSMCLLPVLHLDLCSTVAVSETFLNQSV